MRRIVRFYQNIQPANNRVFYTRDDILNKWSDYRLQVRKNYIQWLFPLETDTGDIKMTSGLLYKFRTNPLLRRYVIRSVLRFMDFFGFTVKIENGKPVGVTNTKPVYREEDNVIIGLYNPDNFPRITRILQFLNVIHMENMGVLFFLMLCKAMKENPDLKQLINNQVGVLQSWIKTQSYLAEHRYDVEEIFVGQKLEDWEKSEIELEDDINDAWD